MKTKRHNSILALLFIVVSCSLFTVSCSKDDSDDDGDGGNGGSEYQGLWEGTFTGDDQGTFQVTIDEDGDISGTVSSETYNEVFNATGHVSGSGNFSATAGSTSGGASFNGQISGTSLTGTWENTAFGESGTFSGSLSGGNNITNPNGCNIDDEIASVQQALNTFQNNPTSQTCSNLRQAVLNMLDAAQNCENYESLQEAYQTWLDMDCSGF